MAPVISQKKADKKSREYMLRLKRLTYDDRLNSTFPENTTIIYYKAKLINARQEGPLIEEESVKFYTDKFLSVGNWTAKYHPPVGVGSLEMRMWLAMRKITSMKPEDVPEHLRKHYSL